MSNLEQMFHDHMSIRKKNADVALNALNYRGLILGSGEPFTYFDDDNDAPFRSNPHFAHWCPAVGPHHFIKYEPGRKPILFYYSPDDFWHAYEPLGENFWRNEFEIIEIKSVEKIWSELGNLSNFVFVGNETKYAHASNVVSNCQLFVSRLNWYRRFKSDYEIYCISEANHLAAKGHLAAKKSFLEGKSEYEIHLDYLKAISSLDADLPYNGIVALDKNAATLHYQNRELRKNGSVLLIDSGAKVNHYPSDITRTYTTQNCDPLFKDLLVSTEKMQLELCDLVKTGSYFPALHEICHKKIAEILENHGILKIGGDYDMALSEGLTKPFFPHGLGHLLGIQVHDIGGKQLDEQGNVAPLNPANINYRSLRFVGTLEDQVVVTIEPGIYFIPMLLKSLKEDNKLNKYVEWNKIERLIPFGGIRIEDDVLTNGDSNRNLTRETGI